ncbi:E3 SUMO-protein ligase PIAS1 [Anabrus simplex]|uniref:E3 SUMO-protein ligase PIAS1 n=1 Tax=Anabrus simplex TaxID=316456 RepID=UPI0035A3D302
MPRHSTRKTRGVHSLPSSCMAESEELKRMVMSFKKQELQTILQFAGLNKLGKKAELQARTMRMVKKGDPSHLAKVRELYDLFGRPHLPGHVTYPVHPDVKLVGLPFYEILGELIKPSSLIPSSPVPKQVANFEFHLTPQQAMSVSTSNLSIEVQMRFCQLLDSPRPQEDFFPPDVNVKVNRLLCCLPAPIPSTKAGVEPKRPQCPVNITPLVLLNPTVPNEISVSWLHEYGRGYVIAVYLVRKLTSSDLLQKLRAKGVRHSAVTLGTIKEKLLGDADCELATTSLKVSLLCPLGKSRMVTPCRANTCQHLQCFDASMYLQMNERKSTWICPVCHESALYENLLIDGYFLQMLSSPKLPQDCTDIVLYEDGLWAPKEEEPIETVPEAPVLDVDNDDLMIIEFKPMKPEKAEKPDKINKISDDIPVIDLISSDEEEESSNIPSAIPECSSDVNISADDPIIVPDSPSSTSSTDSASTTLT